MGQNMPLFKLTSKKLRTLPDGLHSDGGNLYLRVRGNARSWIYRFRCQGQLTDLGLGSLNVVGLAAARERAQNIRTQIAQGENPALSRTRDRSEAKRLALQTKRIYLGDFIDDALAHAQKLRRASSKYWLSSKKNAYLKYAASKLAGISIQKITKFDVHEVLSPLWEDHRGVAVNVLTTLRYCYSYAILKGWFVGTPPTDWQNCLDALLPPKPPAKKHHSSLPWQEIPRLYAGIHASPRDAQRDLLLLNILCATRFGEIAQLKHEDIDREKRTFTVRIRKDRNPEPFIIPYAKQCDEFLPDASEGLAFPNSNGKAYYASLIGRRLKHYQTGITTHGFRATFSTWCADNGKDPYVRELCLCHKVDNAVAAAYQRSNLLEQRRQLLQEWADYVTSQLAP